MEDVPQAEKGTTRDIVANQSGFGSGKNFERAKYIAENANEETIKALDEGCCKFDTDIVGAKIQVITNNLKYAPAFKALYM